MAHWGDTAITETGFTKYKHVKTGGVYELMHLGLEVTQDEAVPSVVYRSENGQVFIQTKDRFFDGRFVRL